MFDRLIQNARQAMDKVVAGFNADLKTLHTGRASAGMVEGVVVSHYNTTLPVKQLATVSVPDANSIVITPWDKGAAEPIRAALMAAQPSLQVLNDGNAVRVVLPPPSQERRDSLVEMVRQKSEGARIAFRQVREETWKSVQEGQRNGQLTEDDRYAAEKQLNKLIEDYNGKIKELVEQKEKEIREF